MKLYVEGGGDAAMLKSECRKGFSGFIKKAGITKMPRVVACGSRQDAYKSYCIAIDNDEEAFLLVDAEEQINALHQQGDADTWQPWAHLKARKGDNWDKPTNAPDTECHLMTQVMESWFIADRSTLRKFFGSDFKDTKLPSAGTKIETLAKAVIFKSLKDATNTCKTKGQYGKGPHSFKILFEINPANVVEASPWAGRFISELKKKMDP